MAAFRSIPFVGALHPSSYQQHQFSHYNGSSIATRSPSKACPKVAEGSDGHALNNDAMSRSEGRVRPSGEEYARTAFERAEAYKRMKHSQTRKKVEGRESEGIKDSGAEELYKPKVATWGVFPRPPNISETYGGGRTIAPGQQLETKEQMEMREARTKQVLDEYRKKVGLDVEPALKVECEKILKQGDSMMDKGKLQNALVCFEKVVQQMPFESSLHGYATLQLSLCFDSMGMYEEARSMYEKISKHPDNTIQKKAKQLLFGFQAAQKLKFSTSSELDTLVYRKYFDAFADGYNTTYKSSGDESSREWLFSMLVSGIFLVFPIILVFMFVAMRHT